MTRVTSDVETLNELFSSGVVTVFGDVFTLVAIMAMMLAIDWRLALVTFAVIPLVWLTARIFRRRVRQAFGDIRVRLARLNAFLQERLSGMRVVQLFGREEDTARAVRGAQPGSPRGASPLDHGLRGVLPGGRGADRGRDGPAALVRRAPRARRHPHGRRAGGVHPVHPPLLPAAAGPVARSSTCCRARWPRPSASSRCSTSR